MLIQKIQLKNITTHKDTTIEFQEGINVLLGKNGTGKSSILNMIGYVLFDFTAATQKTYVRSAQAQNPNYGRIRVWIVGDDENLYKIERTIAKAANTIEVSEERTGQLIRGVSDKASLIEWLHDQFNLKEEMDISNIFETAIGVPQGTYTEPFLRTPTNRKKFFNPLLQVDVYRNVWKNMRNLVKVFENEYHEIENKTSELKGILQQKEGLEEQKEAQENEREILNKDLKEKNQKYQETKEKFEDLKDKKEKLSKLNEQFIAIEKDKDNILEKIENISREIAESEKSVKIVKITKQDAIEYQKHLQKEKELGPLNEEFEKLKDKLKDLENKNEKIEGFIENLVVEIREIEGQKEQFKKYEGDFVEKKELNKNLDKIKKEIADIESNEKQIEKKKEKYMELTKKINKLKNKLSDFSKIKLEVAKIEELRDKKRDKENNVIELQTKIKEFQNNKKKSKGGNCPILNEKCKNIEEGNLEDFFAQKVDIAEEKLVPMRKELENLSIELNTLEKLEEDLQVLRDIKSKLESIEEQKLDIGKDLSNLKKEIQNKEKALGQREKINSNLEKIEDNVNKYHILKEKLEEELPKKEKKLEKYQCQKQQIEKRIKPIKLKFSELEEIPNKIQNIRKKLQDLRENHDKFQINKKIAKKLPKLEKSFSEFKSEKIKIEEKYKIIAKKVDYLKEEYNEQDFYDLEEDLKQLNKIVIELQANIKNTNEKIRKNKDDLDKLEKIEEEYKILERQKEWIKYLKMFVETIRNWFDEAGPKITEALLKQIEQLATELYRDLMDIDSVKLNLENDYNVIVKTAENEKEFSQLSGGEQMSAALAVRLAILKILTNIDFAFFDEPTTNLDEDKRVNLAQCIQNIKGFKQLFVISHDDTFEENADYVIKFDKNRNEETEVNYLGKEM